MADDNDKKDDQLQDMRMQIEGLTTNMKTLHERLDSTVTSSNEWFDQINLAQTAAKTTIDALWHDLTHCTPQS
jgi:phage shock protein A